MFKQKKRSLGCVLYELIYLMVAFPQGQDRVDTPIPSLNGSRIFFGVLQK